MTEPTYDLWSTGQMRKHAELHANEPSGGDGRGWVR